MQWKIERDPYYKQLYALTKDTAGDAVIKEAGFIYDSDVVDRDVKSSVNILCTPLAKTIQNLKVYDALVEEDLGPAKDAQQRLVGQTGAIPLRKNRFHPKGPCVLLSTGSFCPIHEGHVLIMGQARDAMERAGYHVIGGYISPSHDEYIKAKTGEKWIPIHYRLREIYRITRGSDWLSVDPWEGVFNKVAINFTDVVLRLETYLEQHLGRKIPVFFVCGADNAKFALTFVQSGNCVVIGRPGYENDYNLYKNKTSNLMPPNSEGKIYWSPGGNTLSSTGIRRARKFSRDVMPNLILRVEEVSDLEQPVIGELKKRFASVEEKLLSEQLEQFKDMSHLPLITMDALIKEDKNATLAISRNYDIYGQELIGYANRPGTLSLETQANKIQPGSYYLFDDDIHTGGTMRFAKSVLAVNSTVKIKGAMAFSISSSDEGEILDCRDFIINENADAGLVIKLPSDENVRAPYLFPYVDPFVRGSIEDPLEFMGVKR